MPECDTRFLRSRFNDSRAQINTKVNAVIAAATTGGIVDVAKVYQGLGASVSSNPLSSNANKSAIELWAESLPTNFVFPMMQGWTKYSGFTRARLFWWASDGIGYDRTLSPMLKVNGIYVGLDKLGHFMQQGYSYYQLVTTQGRTLAQAKEWGHQTEYGVYGLATTGVYSLADKNANLQGYHFYSWLAANPTTPFDIATYINANWNEENTVCSYRADLAPYVWQNLLQGTWNGQFTIAGDPNNPLIAVRAQFTATGGTAPTLRTTTLSGTFGYTYNSGPVHVRFNAGVQFIPFISPTLGYRGVRIDFAWRSGQNTGRGTWRSGYSENTLRGTWGWNNAYSGGGTMTLRRNP